MISQAEMNKGDILADVCTYQKFLSDQAVGKAYNAVVFFLKKSRGHL